MDLTYFCDEWGRSLTGCRPNQFFSKEDPLGGTQPQRPQSTQRKNKTMEQKIFVNFVVTDYPYEVVFTHT